MAVTRDGIVLAMAMSAVHVGLNMLPSLTSPQPGVPVCPYDGYVGFFMSLATFCLFLPSLFATLSDRFLLVRDVIGFVPGVWFQVTVKPEGFFANVPIDGCDMRNSGYAMMLWLLGEALTFGASVRVLRPLWRRSRLLAFLAVVAFVPAGVVTVDLVTKELRGVYKLAD